MPHMTRSFEFNFNHRNKTWRHQNPTKKPTNRTAALLITEPFFAGIFAIVLWFDPFDWKVIIGAR
jgi:hypothetical protein